MTAPADTIYYTTDGTDPRVEGGDISPTAATYTTAIPLNASVTVLRDRVKVTAPGDRSVKLALRRAFPPMDRISDSAKFSIILQIPLPRRSRRDLMTKKSLNSLSSSTSRIRPSIWPTSNFGRSSWQTTWKESISVSLTETIPELAPGERVVVVENLEAFAFRYGSDLPVAGEWSGGLSNRSERITLMAGEETIHSFSYDDGWVPETDGDGPSLQIIDEQDELEFWELGQSWRASYVDGGTPGTSDSQLPGDSNHDGLFDSNDIVLVFQAGKYEDEIPNNATFEEGDWDGNGDFDTQDFVYVFQMGHYETGEALLRFAAGPLTESTRSISMEIAAALQTERTERVDTATVTQPTLGEELVQSVTAPLDSGAPVPQDRLFDEWKLASSDQSNSIVEDSLSDELLDMLASNR